MFLSEITFTNEIVFYSMHSLVKIHFKENKLTFYSIEGRDQADTSSPLCYIDLEFINDLSQASSTSDLEEKLKTINTSSQDFDKSISMINSYKKALSYSLQKLYYGEPMDYRFTKIGDRISLNNLSEITFFQIAKKLEGTVNGIKIIIFKQEDMNFSYQYPSNLPSQGFITLKLLLEDEKKYIRKYGSAYQAASFFFDNNNKFNKFLSVLQKSEINISKKNSNFNINSLHFNKDQSKLYYNLIGNQLTLAEGFAGTG